MTVKTKSDLMRLISDPDHQQRIREFGISRIGFFGSFVHGECTPQSDVDVLVQFAPGRKSFDGFMGLSSFLESIFGRRVELVTIESLSPYIGPRILKEVEYASLGI